MIDVLFNAALPERERQGIPEWPVQVREASGEQPERGWIRMSREEYEAHRARHEAAQMAWIAAHPPPAPPPPVPAYVTNFQARAALLQVPAPEGSEAPTMFHHIDGVLRARQHDPEFAIAWQAWEFANEFYRHSATVQGLAAMFGLDAMLDDLFRAASQIEA